MAETVSDQLPPWLQRNIAYREPFDPTPWLQERYRRKVQAEEIPLRIQGLQLQNAQAQLQIQQQAMATELQGIQLQQYQTELPMLNEAAKLAAQDPNAFRNRPMTFKNPTIQKQYLDLRKMVAESDYALAAEKKIAQEIELAGTIAKETGFLVKRDQNGMIDPESLAMGSEALALQKEKNFNALHPSVSPEIVTLKDSSGNPVDVIRTGPNTFSQKREPSAETISVGPDGTTTITRGTAGKPTPPMITNAENAISGAVSAARLGSTLINRLRPEDIGILGKGGEILVDEGLAQIIPEVANLKRIDARTLLKLYKNDAVRALKIDSQMTETERKRYEDILPSEDSTEALPDAIQKIKTFNREVATRARFSAQRAGRQIPNELLLPAELIAKVKSGELTKAQALELAKSSPFRDDFDALLPR